MVIRNVIYKTFTTYTDVLYYLRAIQFEFEYFNINYGEELYYREVFNDYKVIIKVYDN